MGCDRLQERWAFVGCRAEGRDLAATLASSGSAERRLLGRWGRLLGLLRGSRTERAACALLRSCAARGRAGDREVQQRAALGESLSPFVLPRRC